MPSTDRAVGLATPARPAPPSRTGPAMKAVAVMPGKPNSMHLAELPKALGSCLHGRG